MIVGLGLKPVAADEATELTTKVQTLENENKREEGKIKQRKNIRELKNNRSVGMSFSP